MINDSQEKSRKKAHTQKDRNFARKYLAEEILSMEVSEPVSISVSEAAKLSGVTTKTIRRAIQNKLLSYTVVKDRYVIDFRSVIKFLHTKRKLKNKLNQSGIGQYIKEWYK